MCCWLSGDWSSDVCSSDLPPPPPAATAKRGFAAQAGSVGVAPAVPVGGVNNVMPNDNGNASVASLAAVKRGRPAKQAVAETPPASSLVDDIASLLAGMGSDD